MSTAGKQQGTAGDTGRITSNIAGDSRCQLRIAEDSWELPVPNWPAVVFNSDQLKTAFNRSGQLGAADTYSFSLVTTKNSLGQLLNS
jgi:hypothetical protein